MTDKERLDHIKQCDPVQAIKDLAHYGNPENLKLEKVYEDIEFLIQQAEQTESFKVLHKNYLDRFVEGVGERNSLKEENERLKMELELAKPLFSRRQLIAENKRLREALQFYADEDNNLLVDCENTNVSIDGGRTAREALGGVSID